MAADTVREECDERTGEYRENEAGEDRDPLQDVIPSGLSEESRASEGLHLTLAAQLAQTQ